MTGFATSCEIVEQTLDASTIVEDMIARRGWARTRPFRELLYDSAYGESHVQERREPGTSAVFFRPGLKTMSGWTILYGRSRASFAPSTSPSSVSVMRIAALRSGTATLRSGRSVEAVPLRLHQPDQIVAPVGAGSLPQSGTDLAVEEPEARLPDDRELPQGELGSPEGREPQFRAAASRT